MTRLSLRLRWVVFVSWLRAIREPGNWWAYRPGFLFRRRHAKAIRTGTSQLPQILPDGDDVWACPWHLTNVTAVRLEDGRPMGTYRRCELPLAIQVPVVRRLTVQQFAMGQDVLPDGPAFDIRTYGLRYLPNHRTAVYA